MGDAALCGGRPQGCEPDKLPDRSGLHRFEGAEEERTSCCQRKPLSLPTQRRPTLITTTGLHFTVEIGGEGAVELRLIA